MNPKGASAFLLIGDHAGNAVPTRLDGLGVSDAERARHIGWDIGVASLGVQLARALDAVFIHQSYSRLVIDCNRRPGAADSIPEVSDLTSIPGNVGLSAEERAARVAAVHAPYQEAIAAELTRRDAAGTPTILVALHSFTPAMQRVARPWEVGVLHDKGELGFAHALLAEFGRDGTLTVGDNEPYRMDQIDYTIPLHAYPKLRPYAEIEIRQDLLADDAGVADWCARLVAALPAARART